MMYVVSFLDSDLFEDEMWFDNPKVGDEFRIGMFSEAGQSYWTIESIEDGEISARQVEAE